MAQTGWQEYSLVAKIMTKKKKKKKKNCTVKVSITQHMQLLLRGNAASMKVRYKVSERAFITS